MIKRQATRLAAVALAIVGLTITPVLDRNDPPLIALDQPATLQTPEFEISWQKGTLLLSGHTLSARHEQDLRQVAAASFPDAIIATRFRPLGITPAYWQDATIGVVYLLAETVAAEATITADEIIIRSVAIDDLGWRSRLQALQDILPNQVPVQADSIVVDARISVSASCDRAFELFEAGAIKFEESNANFRSSAYPRLDRAIALADFCSAARISITGHTDASGNEAWNQRLSLKRAHAVAKYMTAHGIDQTRLSVSGVGSEVAIASNETRYGRSLNRRIEISFKTRD